MPVRTTSDDVKAIMVPGKDYDTRRNPSLTPFLRSASLIVDRLVKYGSDRSITVNSDEAVDIETWLSAHLYCMSDQTYASRSTDGASGSFHGQTAMRFEATKYGQTAMTIDPTGYLTILNKGRVTAPSIGWGGTAEGDRRTWDEINYPAP